MATSASFFSGVGGLDHGLHNAGWRTVSFSEIDKYASAVLDSRFPGVPNYGSITDWRDWPDGEWQQADLWAGGPPCQDFSIAGKRAGLAGARSGLALTWFDAVEHVRPRAIILENVPGILSSNGGADLRALTVRLEELGYGWAYRTLNARWFGVPQRRRRVFLLAVHARSGLGADDAGEVLAVSEVCPRHPGARGEAREDDAADSGDGTSVGSVLAREGKGPVHNYPDDHLVPFVKRHRAASVTDSETWATDDVSPTLNGFDTGDSRATVAIAFAQNNRGEVRDLHGVAGALQQPGSNQTTHLAFVGKVAATLNSNKSGGWRYDPDQAENLVAMDYGVRRLTPLECERLQGWPDGWTIPNEWRGRRFDGSDLLPEGLDSARYRCIGNGVASPVAEWIGGRLLAAMSAIQQTEGVA